MQEPPSKRGRGAVSGRGRKPGIKNSKAIAVKRKAPPSPGTNKEVIIVENLKCN